jgi:hypothetical protein
MQRRIFVLLVGSLLVGAAICANAATVRLGPLPRNFQHQVTVLATFGASDLAYFPTVAPRQYGYGGGSVASCENLVLLQDARYRTSMSEQQPHTVEFSVKCFTGSNASCARGATRTLRTKGVAVYWDGTTAWRCVRTSKNRLAKLSASKTWGAHPTLPLLSRSDLAAVVASAEFVSR